MTDTVHPERGPAGAVADGGKQLLQLCLLEAALERLAR